MPEQEEVKPQEQPGVETQAPQEQPETQAPAATESQTPPEGEKPPETDPILSVIAEDLGIAVDGKPVEKAPPAEEKPKPTETPPAPKPDEPKPVVVAKKKTVEEIIEAGVDRVLADRAAKVTAEQPQPSRASAPAEQKPETQAKPDEFSDWGPEEKAELSIAEAAERVMPEKYKGMRGKLIEFKKRVDEYVSKAQQENPERTLDENDEEFMSFVESVKPKYEGADRRSIERKVEVEEAASEAERRVSGKLQAQERRIRELTEKPAVESAVKKFEDDLAASMCENDPELPELAVVAAKVKELGPEKAAEASPVIGTIVAGTMRLAKGVADTYMRLSRGVVDFDPNNEEHVWVAQFIMNQGKMFAEKGGELRIRADQSGRKRSFLPRAEFAEVATRDRNAAANYWTFDDSDVLAMLAANAKMIAREQSKKIVEGLRAEGYVRQVQQNGSSQPPNKPQAPAPQRAKSPSVQPTPSPGPTQGAANQTGGAFSSDELAALGIKL